MSAKKDLQFVAYRGEIKALVGRGEELFFVTVHTENQATPLYQYNPNTEALTTHTLICEGGAKNLCAVGDQFFVVGTDDSIEVVSPGQPSREFLAPQESSVIALASVAGGRLAVLRSFDLLIVDQQTGATRQSFALPTEMRSLAVNPNGEWLAVGSASGTMSIFHCEKQENQEFIAGDSAQVHQSAITSILFEPDDLRVLSAGLDNKIFQTHVRGRLDPEDRSRKSGHDGAVRRMLIGPNKVFYSGSADSSFKTWPGGLTNQRPFTIKDGVGSVIDMSLVTFRNRPHLAVATQKTEFRFWDLSEEGRPQDRTLVVKGALARVRNELKHKEASRRKQALNDLASYNDAASIEILGQRCLDDEDHELRAYSTQLLGDSGNLRAVEILEGYVRSKEEGVRQQALLGLRKLEGQKTLRPLDLAIKSGHIDIGLMAVEALRDLARDDGDAFEALKSALEAKSWDVRKATLNNLESLYSEAERSHALLDALRSNQADIRRLALARCHSYQLSKVREIQSALRRHCEDSDADVRQTAFFVSVLSEAKLANALRSQDGDLHRQLSEVETFELSATEAEKQVESFEAAQARIGTVGELNDDDRRPLLQGMASRSLDTCLRGATSLALLKDSRAFGSLLQLSRESQEATRVEVCKALKNLADDRGIARLKLMIRDGQASVRDAAFSALVHLEQKQPLNAAQAGLQAEHKDIRGRGLQLLIEQIRAFMPESSDALSWRLLERALNDSFAEVRKEAFKATLNLQFAGGGEKTLRFALSSLHKDIRKEVFVEVTAQMKELWAWGLLYDFFNDPDSGLRSEAFEFANRRSKGKAFEVFAKSMAANYADMRQATVTALEQHKDQKEACEELLFKALDDDEESVRNKGLEVLLSTGSNALARVMKSRYPDIRARAAHARAMQGDPDALIPLLQLATEKEPEISDHKTKWQRRVLLSLQGLSLLGLTGALETLESLLKSDNSQIRKAAAEALALCSRPGNIKPLKAALRHQDSNVRYQAALGLAICGETDGLSLIFDPKANQQIALNAGIALGEKSLNQILSFLDHKKDSIRNQAFLALMMLQIGSKTQQSNPDLCLAGLSAESPEIRLKSAQALENYANRERFGEYVVELFNDRGEDKKLTISAASIHKLSCVLAQAPSWLRYRAAYYLSLTDNVKKKKSEFFEQSWALFAERYSKEIADLQAPTAEQANSLDMYEIASLVFGTYVGLSRLQDGGNAAQIRQTALKRLFRLSIELPELSGAVRPVVVQSLADSNAQVRKQAFELFETLALDINDLCSEALASGHRDIGALGFQKLLTGADSSTSGQLLEHVLRNHDDGLEHEALQALSKQLSGIQALQLAFDARSTSLRKHAVLTLAKRYEEADAATALVQALKSKAKDTRVLAAQELAIKKNEAAFAVLAEMLTSRNRNEQSTAIKSFLNLQDSRAAGLMLDRIDNDPAGTAKTSDLFNAVGELRDTNVIERLMTAIKKNQNRDYAFNAAFKISGYDQRITEKTFEPEPNGTINMKDANGNDLKFPVRSEILNSLLKVVTRIADDDKIKRLMASTKLCRDAVIEESLLPLAAYPRDNVRHEALNVICWRARKRSGSVTAIEKALEHEEGMTRFYAAEGLALLGRKDGLSVLLSSVELVPELHLRRRAVKALGALGDQQALDLLLGFINETGHALQEEAAEALGHMSHTDQAENVFKILSKLSQGSYGVALSAMTGLRYFNSDEAWNKLRDRCKDSSWTVRQHVAELLRHDKDQGVATELLEKLIRTDSDSDVAKSAVESLRKITGTDSLNADYALICSPISWLVSEALKKLKDHGEASKMLNLLPMVSNQSLQSVVDVLLSRTPLPLADAAKVLETSKQGRTLSIAAQILGRGGEEAKKYGASMAQACENYRAVWDEKNKYRNSFDTGSDSAEETETYRLLLWSCSRLGVNGEVLVPGADPKYPKVIREAALSGLSQGLAGEAGIKALETALQDADAELRALAAAGLRRLAPERAAVFAKEVLDDRTSLDRLLSGLDNDSSRGMLREAVGTVHHQGVALPHLIACKDIEGLQASLTNKSLSESARLGAIEGLARLAMEQAESVLGMFAQDASEDEDLRKAAWRAIRRSKRYRAKVASSGPVA